MLRRLSYWLHRLRGAVPCTACGHPGRVHESGECFRMLPRCLWCMDAAESLRVENSPWHDWRRAASLSQHGYVPRGMS